MKSKIQQMSDTNDFEMKMKFERIFPPGSNIYVKVVAYLETPIDYVTFKDAVTKLAYKHPLLRVRYDIRNDEWYFTTEGGAFPETSLVNDSSDQVIENTIIELNRNPVVFDGEHPTSRFVLFKGKDRDVILTYLHHSIADGRAVAFVMKHLLEFIADPDKEINPLVPVSLTDVIPDDVKPSRFMSLMLRVFRWRWNKEKVTFTAEEIRDASKAYSQKSPELYIPVKLSKEETAKLRERAHSENCTVNSAILAALVTVKHTSEEFRDTANTIAMAVDTRRLLEVDVGEACSVLATGISIKLNDRSPSEFWNLAREISSKTEEQLLQPEKILKQRITMALMDPTFNDGHFMMTVSDWEGTPFLKRSFERGKSRIGIILTNLGGLELPDSYKGSHPLRVSDIEFIMPIQSNEMLSVAAASLGGKLTLIFPNRPDKFKEQEQQKIANRTISILREII